MGETDFKKEKVWWAAGVQIFSEVSAWIAIPVVLALFLGKALDSHYGTKPFLLLVSALAGFLISSFGIVSTVKKHTKDIKKK